MRSYLISLCAGSIFVSLIHALAPDGSFKKIVEFTGGLLLLIIVVSPVVKLETTDFVEIATSVLSDYEDLSTDFKSDSRTRMDQIITEKCEEYILDKAETLGMAVDVKLKMDTSAAVSYPTGVKIYGKFSDVQRAELSKILEQDLGIPVSDQEWIND